MATGAAPDPGGSKPPLPEVLRELLPHHVPPPPKLSEELGAVIAELQTSGVTLRKLMVVLQGRGYVLLILLLALPFASPIPLVGFSTPFGLLIMLIAMRLALGRKPWIPQRMLDAPLSGRGFHRFFGVTRRIVKGFEYFLRPRLAWLTSSPILLQLHAVPIFAAAALLLLPIPVPFSNSLPAYCILLIAAGLIERDGLFIICGYFALVVAAAFIAIIGILGVEGFDMILDWLAGRGG
jgi:hypothetical protein